MGSLYNKPISNVFLTKWPELELEQFSSFINPSDCADFEPGLLNEAQEVL